MKHISIMVPLGHISLTNIEGTHQILTEVNTLRVSLGMEPLFKIQLVGLSRAISHGTYTIKPELTISEVDKTDLIIIPAMHGNQEKAIKLNSPYVPWILQQYNNGAELASFCIGSFFLASTGILKGKQCATHWMLANEFRNMFPDVDLVDDKILTAEDGIYTSGGAYSYLNLLIYLIEKYAGREIAILISKAFMIDIDKFSQSPFIMFQGQKEHEDEQIKNAQEFIEQNFEDRITVDQIAAMSALGRRSLERRFKKATGNTVIEYIQRVKMEAAKKSFETSRKNINEVMFAVGYSDNKAFRSVFKKITGLSPLVYRNKYNRDAMAV